MTVSLMPWRRGRSAVSVLSVSNAAPATVAALHPEQRDDDDRDLLVRCDGREHERRGEQRLAEHDRRDPSDAVGEHAEDRREPVHPEDVQRDRRADHERHVIGREVREVDRRHRHDGGHDHVRPCDGEDRVARRDGPVGLDDVLAACLTALREPLRREERIGPERSEVQHERGDLRDDRECVRTGQRRHAEELSDGLTGGEQERPGDGADRRRPDHRAEVAPATTGVGEVGRGEPRLQIAGVARTDQEDPDDQQGEQPQRRGRDDHRDADEGEQVAERERDAPAAPGGETGERDRAQ